MHLCMFACISHGVVSKYTTQYMCVHNVYAAWYGIVFKCPCVLWRTRIPEQIRIDDKLPEAARQRIRSCQNVLVANFC